AVDEGLRLWLAHVRPLRESGAPVLVFEAADFLDRADAIAEELGLGKVDRSTYVAELVHHGAVDGADPALLADCLALYEGPAGASLFPWKALDAALAAVSAGNADAVRMEGRAARAAVRDPAAVVAPLGAALLQAHRADLLLDLLDAAALPAALD